MTRSTHIKFFKLALTLVAGVLFLYSGDRIAEHLARRNQSEWAAVQSKRCAALGVILYRYFESHGSYPDELEQLVTSGFMTEARYGGLMFQEKRNSEPLEWQYRNPGTSHHYLLFSGKSVKSWNCPIESYVAGGVGGSAIVFGREKLASFLRREF